MTFHWRVGMLLALVLAIIEASCSRPKPVVVLDTWWDSDYAKNLCTAANEWYHENAEAIAQFGCPLVSTCPEMMPRVTACTPDSALNAVREFESDLTTQLAADSRCDGVQFVAGGPADKASAEAMTKSHWFLMLYFTPGAREQSWSMARIPGATSVEGSGDAKQIAGTICAVAKERGASLQ